MMPPHRGLGCMYVYLILQVTCALKLDIPSDVDVFPGETMTISWTSTPGDPKTMDLVVSCILLSESAPSSFRIASVSTASASYHLEMPASLADALVLSRSCNLQARETDSNVVLDEAKLNLSFPDIDSLKPTPPSTSESSPMSTATPGETTTTSSTSHHTTSSESTSESTSAPTSVSLRITSSTVVSFSPSSDPTTSSTFRHTSTSTSESTRTSTIPLGAIVGGVVGGFVGLGTLVILPIICLRRRRLSLRPPPTPVPLPYINQNDLQQLDKNGRLAQIADERETAQRQHDQLQTEAESIHLRESVHGGLSGLSDTPSGSGPVQQQIEALRQRILELEAQQRDFEHQLYHEQSPPSYSNV